MRAPWNVSVGRYLAITQKVMTNQRQTVWTLEPCNISHVAAFGTSAFFFSWSSRMLRCVLSKESTRFQGAPHLPSVFLSVVSQARCIAKCHGTSYKTGP